MILVIDTNVLLPLFSPRSPYRELVRVLVDGRVAWAVSQPILAEYEEVVVERSGRDRWRQVIKVMELLGARHHNVIHVNPSYHFQVIEADPDDNKFTDCAITVGADFVITEDRDFTSLAEAGYKPRPITPADFVATHLADD